ncbi:non-ribosomal peptide synthetase [Streptomyces sp. NPDC048018]|uniref:non-ribosomal peptide synthetase n=1 Tax=Streptomyces sp. NPDC048018 TaxID=3365499 RepID=UPI003724ABCE
MTVGGGVVDRRSGAPFISVHGTVSGHAARRPGDVAVVDADGTSLTYAELWRRAGWTAAALAAQGVRPGDRVAVALPRSARLVIALLGVARLGAAYVPLDSHAPRARLELLVDEARPVAVVTGDDPSGLPVGPVRVGVPAAAPDAPVPDAPDVDADTPLYVGYTSGSTGRPKGAVITHGAVRSFTYAPDYCPVRPGDRVAALANPAFDATTFEVWNTLAAGATIVVLPDVMTLPMQEWAELLGGASVTSMFLTTSLFDSIAREAPDAFHTVDNVLVGGEALDIERARRVLDHKPPRRLVHVYGPTETTTFATAFLCTGENLTGRSRVPLGAPVQETRLRVLDEQRRPVAPGGTGELYISGPQVAAGYLDAPELTAERFVVLDDGDRAYRSGDLVRLLDDGELEFAGRIDRQVKLRGFRIEPAEIEQALLATGLVSAAVVEKTGEAAGGALVAFVLPADPAHTAGLTARLAELLGERLPGYMVPARWLVVADIPLNANGKTDRRRLLEIAEEAGAPVPGVAQPAAEPADADDPSSSGGAGPLAELYAVLAELLRLDRVGPDDNFLELGGNSILALQATSRLRARGGADLNPADLLFAETLAELAGPAAAGPADTAR